MAKEALIRKKAIEILTEKNYICWFPPKVKYQQTDIFGIVDLLAVRKRERKSIQLTTVSNISARRKKIVSFFKKSDVEFPVEIWAWDAQKKKFKKERVNSKSLKVLSA